MDRQALGIDVGTSGIRACLIDTQARVLAQSACDLPSPQRNGERVEQDPHLWQTRLLQTIDALAEQKDLQAVHAIALDGTSGTLLYSLADGTPLTPALLYNDARARAEADRIASSAPRDTGAHGASSGLAKALWLRGHYALSGGRYMNQADWLTGCLTGSFTHSDENNALKLGYDPVRRCWPGWLEGLGLSPDTLPEVVPPGTALAPLAADLAQRWGIPQARLHAGTTDSIAAFIATGAARPGDAVTSLGSTLVLKVLSERPVFAPQYGVYSHRLGDLWLAGGASNSGGAVLRHYFDDAQLAQMTPQLRPDEPTGLDYYPLPAPGERFPLQDPTLAPRMTPRPAEDRIFFQALLEGIARIEQQGYARLAELGAPYPTRVLSAGGGARNPAWTRIREHLLGVPVEAAEQQDAAYGAARLALQRIQ